jgi:RimJ/RimL family protein N-acetyltransferase
MTVKEVELKDGRGILLREAMSDDIDRLTDFYKSLSEEVLIYGLPPYDRTRIERFLSGFGRDIIVLALDHEKVVGHLQIFVYTLQRLKGIGELIIYLHQDYLNKGLGTQMMTFALELARRKGLHRVFLQVVKDNTRAVHLYMKMGFVVEGILKDAYFGVDGHYHDMLLMAKIFD